MVVNHPDIHCSRTPGCIYMLKIGKHKHFASENKGDRKDKVK